ncbi:hypothetical protein GOODEAATRI_007517, partial [Goodea atripinnis]
DSDFGLHVAARTRAALTLTLCFRSRGPSVSPDWGCFLRPFITFDMADPSLTSPSGTPLRSPNAPLTLSFPFPREGNRSWQEGREPPLPRDLPSPLPTKRNRTYSAIEGEYVPVEGDEVTYKVCRVPPKNIKVQAVEVKIIHLNPGTKHETWSGQIISS